MYINNTADSRSVLLTNIKIIIIIKINKKKFKKKNKKM